MANAATDDVRAAGFMDDVQAADDAHATSATSATSAANTAQAANDTHTKGGLMAGLRLGGAAELPAEFLLGHASDPKGATGCTVVLFEGGAVASVSVRGAAPASIETDLLDPQKTVQSVNAVVLSGGSAFGLEASSGVRQWLREHNVGFAVDDVRVPIVCGASIYDLAVGACDAYPSKAMGYVACKAATASIETGNVGAGIGASVGKLLGDGLAMKGGLGAASLSLGDLLITALVVVNAVGNVVDPGNLQPLAGTRDPQDLTRILNAKQALEIMAASAPITRPLVGKNTTLGCLLTNARISKVQAARIADAAHDGLARAIDPVHTGFDGDAIFTMSSNVVSAEPEYLGIIGAWLMEAAVQNAVLSASSAYNLPAADDLKSK